MIDFFNSILSHSESFRWLFLLALLWVFYRWMNSEDSEGVEWRDFVSAIGVDGKYHGDINRVGQSVGVAIAAFAVVATAPMAYTNFTGFALVLTACLGFLGAVASYAATLRSKQNLKTTVTEPLPEPAPPQKVTVTEPAKPAAGMRQGEVG